MARIVLLDSGPLGLAAMSPGNHPKAAACLLWLSSLESVGVRILIPAVADFEVRRELIRVGIGPSVLRLDALKARFAYLAPGEAAWNKAAELWALVRNAGVPTAGPQDVDADAIIAGQALTVGQPGDAVTIATNNVRHVARFPGVDAQDWPSIT